VNTGLNGGSYGTGKRISLKHTRTIISSIHDGTLANTEKEVDKVFGFQVPTECKDIPKEILNPVLSWKDTASYNNTAKKLVDLFNKNFQKYEKECPAKVLHASPKV